MSSSSGKPTLRLSSLIPLLCAFVALKCKQCSCTATAPPYLSGLRPLVLSLLTETPGGRNEKAVSIVERLTRRHLLCLWSVAVYEFRTDEPYRTYGKPGSRFGMTTLPYIDVTVEVPPNSWAVTRGGALLISAVDDTLHAAVLFMPAMEPTYHSFGAAAIGAYRDVLLRAIDVCHLHLRDDLRSGADLTEIGDCVYRSFVDSTEHPPRALLLSHVLSTQLASPRGRIFAPRHNVFVRTGNDEEELWLSVIVLPPARSWV